MTPRVDQSWYSNSLFIGSVNIKIWLLWIKETRTWRKTLKSSQRRRKVTQRIRRSCGISKDCKVKTSLTWCLHGAIKCKIKCSPKRKWKIRKSKVKNLFTRTTIIIRNRKKTDLKIKWTQKKFSCNQSRSRRVLITKVLLFI